MHKKVVLLSLLVYINPGFCHEKSPSSAIQSEMTLSFGYIQISELLVRTSARTLELLNYRKININSPTLLYEYGYLFNINENLTKTVEWSKEILSLYELGMIENDLDISATKIVNESIKHRMHELEVYNEELNIVMSSSHTPLVVNIGSEIKKDIETYKNLMREKISKIKTLKYY